MNTIELMLEAMRLKQRVTLWENDGDRAKFNAAIAAGEAELKREPDAWMHTLLRNGYREADTQRAHDTGLWMNTPLYLREETK